jgi:hypothetical protein
MFPSLDILRADGIAPPEPASRKASGSKRKKISDDEVEVVEDNDDENELKALLLSIISLVEAVATNLRITTRQKSTKSRRDLRGEKRVPSLRRR